MNVLTFSGIVAGVALVFLIGFIVMWAVCKRSPKDVK